MYGHSPEVGLPKRRSPPVSRDKPGEAARVRRRFEKLLSAGIAVSSERELAKVLQRVVDVARDVVQARYAALGVLTPDGSGLAEFVSSGLSEAERARIGSPPRGRGVLGLVMREAKPIRIVNVGRHPQAYGFPPHHPHMTSFLGVPVLGGGRVFGNLYLTDKIGGDEFTAEDEAIAGLLAAQAAVAVENARLYEETTRLLARVQAMQRQRDQFFAMINHELRNALTGVFGWAEQLVRKKPESAVPPAARHVYEAAERTIALLNNLLDMSRLDAGKVRPVWRDLDVPTAVRRAVGGMEPAAEAKGVAIKEEYPDPPPSLRTDPVRLEQILVNLLSNAVRHSPQGGKIVLRVEAADSELRFHVVDSGPGIAPDMQERIFDPFERFDPHGGPGTGLGLPVSRRLATVLGGRLTVQSTSGQGATFTLALPRVPPSV